VRTVPHVGRPPAHRKNWRIISERTGGYQPRSALARTQHEGGHRRVFASARIARPQVADDKAALPYGRAAPLALCIWRSNSPALRSAAGGPCRWPFKDDVGLVADGAPDADVAKVRTGFGAKEMVSPPFEHRLAAARPTKQEDAPLARDVDLHFVHCNSRRCGLSGPKCRAADQHDRCWLAYCCH
jgi:hypothetical protein